MKKYELIIEQLICKKQTTGLPFVEDDIYIVVIPIKGKVKKRNALINTLSADSLIEGAAILKGLVTDTMRKFDSDDKKVPKKNILEISLEKGEILSVLIILYEEDDAKLKKQLAKTVPNGVDTITLNNNNNFKDILNDIWKEIKEKKGETLETLFGSASSVFFKVAVPTIEISYKLYELIKSDDPIDAHTYEFDFEATDCVLYPEPMVFKGKHGKYILDVKLVETNE